MTQSALPATSGIHDIERRLDSGRAARFTLSIPAHLDAAPVVLVLHYGGQPQPYYGRSLLQDLIEPAYRDLNAIYVAPETINGQWDTPENEAFVLGLLDEIKRTYTVDTAHYVVTGYSMGAVGTWHFIAKHPALFSAAVPIAGFPNRELACSVPVLAFHSANDELFPLDRLRQLVDDSRAGGCDVRLEEAENSGHFDVNGYADALLAVPAWLEHVWSGKVSSNTP